MPSWSTCWQTKNDVIHLRSSHHYFIPVDSDFNLMPSSELYGSESSVPPECGMGKYNEFRLRVMRKNFQIFGMRKHFKTWGMGNAKGGRTFKLVKREKLCKMWIVGGGRKLCGMRNVECGVSHSADSHCSHCSLFKNNYVCLLLTNISCISMIEPYWLPCQLFLSLAYKPFGWFW